MNLFSFVTKAKPSALLLFFGYLAAVAAGIYLVAAGRMEHNAFGPLPVVVLGGLAGLSAFGYSRAGQHLGAHDSPVRPVRDAGILVIAWMLYRSFFPFFWQAALLPFLGLGFLLSRGETGRLTVPLLSALLMESGLLFYGIQSVAVYLAELFSLLLFVFFFLPSRPVFFPGKTALKKQHRPAAPASQPISFKNLVYPPFETPAEKISTDDAIHLFSETLNGLLDLIRSRLGASTVALLWPLSDGNYKARELVTDRSDLLPGPFPAGSGLLAALVQKDSITVHVPRSDGPRLPFHRDNRGIGGFFIQRLALPFHDAESGGKKIIHALLTIDRQDENPFDDQEKVFIERVAAQLISVFLIEKDIRLIALDRDRIQTVCEGLHQLNGVLGLQSVFSATTRIIKGLLPYDLLAISLLENKAHRIAKIDGAVSGVEEGQEFPLDDGLVGQVLKRNHWLPAGASYRDPAPIFSNTIRHREYKSLLVLPLRNEDNVAIGAMVVAGRKPQLITKQRRDLLEVVATQVAVKIDLAQAHEKINQLATVDGLTGLNNHRTFQHGFDMMLERTKRNQCPLCLILCDIDHFKKINDNHGHPFGDVVLKTVAGVLRNTVRRVDLAARYGGEEFAVLLESADEKGGRMMAERIRTEIEKLVVIEGRKHIRVTLSLGLSFFPKDAVSKEQLISYADQALYKAKSRGRNQTVTWSEIAGISTEV